MQSLRTSVLRSAVSAARAVSTTSRSATPLRVNTPRPVAQWRNSSLALRPFSSTSRTGEEAKPEESAVEETEPVEGVVAEAKSSTVDSLKDEPASMPTAIPITPPTQRKSSGRDGETPYGLFIRNMVFEATEENLSEAFSKYGDISKAVIARDARGLSRGYGFVWFNDAAAVAAAIEGTDGSFWHGRRVQVSAREAKTPAARRPTQPPRQVDGPTRSVFIGNIPYETTDEELNKLFGTLDGVQEVRVAVDRTTGWPRGFAHIDFKSSDNASAAFDELKSMTIGGRQLRIDYANDQYVRPSSA